jgi:hypothetical protein
LRCECEHNLAVRMTTLQHTAERLIAERDRPDLDGAFNDGYELGALPKHGTVLRWTVVAWCLVALFIGSYVIVDTIIGMLSTVAARLVASSP